MTRLAAESNSWLPRVYYDRQVEALTIRSLKAENNLIMLLDFIDPDILERNGHDWLMAVQELISLQIPEPRKKGTK